MVEIERGEDTEPFVNAGEYREKLESLQNENFALQMALLGMKSQMESITGLSKDAAKIISELEIKNANLAAMIRDEGMVDEILQTADEETLRQKCLKQRDYIKFLESSIGLTQEGGAIWKGLSPSVEEFIEIILNELKKISSQFHQDHVELLEHLED